MAKPLPVAPVEQPDLVTDGAAHDVLEVMGPVAIEGDTPTFAQRSADVETRDHGFLLIAGGRGPRHSGDAGQGPAYGRVNFMTLSVVILSRNSEATIGATLASAAFVSDDIHVVDSGSNDNTLTIVKAAGAQLYNHPFENYGAQRNWAIANVAIRHPWELHLDADERLSDELVAAILKLKAGGF